MSSPSSFPRDRSGPRLFASPRPEATGEEKADEEALGPGGRIGLVQTFDALARLEKEEIRVTLSLNINSALLLHPDLARWIEAEWQRTGIPNNRLIFEISRDRTGHPRSMASVISSFRRSGVRFALKDGGTPTAISNFWTPFPGFCENQSGNHRRLPAGSPRSPLPPAPSSSGGSGTREDHCPQGS